MMMHRSIAWLAGWSLLVAAPILRADEPPLAEYFQAETARIAARPLGGIESAEAWKQARPELQRRLREMLGLDPLPEKTDLKAEVRRVVERPDFVVEAILFQSRPGLYVTANLYRPKEVKAPLPAILYVCGHSEVKKDGVLYGCKAHYQHHAAWYAANGYVCLVLDTLQLGELPGLHHGTYREGMWWWQSRGYTPAGVEAWNGIRGIDYLLTRKEVDPDRIGVTGRSGGGATSWWLGALDDRIAAVVPVAGITDLTNHVVEAPAPYPNGVIEGHCDCMYFVNTYRWDFPLVAALVAPKPLLVENTDKDPIFPEEGVRRVYAQLEKVYKWYGVPDKLGLVFGKGGHVDSEEIRHPSYAFFEKRLKGKKDDEIRIEEPDRKVPIEDLKVLNPGEVPPDCRNATIQETFLAEADEPRVPESSVEWEKLRNSWMEQLKTKVFAGWPSDEGTVPLDLKTALDVTRDGVRLRAYDFTSQPGVRLRLWRISPAEGEQRGPVVLTLSDERGWKTSWAEMLSGMVGLSPIIPNETVSKRLAVYRDIFNSRRPEKDKSHFILCPRGFGPSAWDAKKDAHLRRRFALLGQTLDGMRCWDVRRGLAAIRQVPELRGAPVELIGFFDSAPIALFAAAFEPDLSRVTIANMFEVRDQVEAILNLDRVVGRPHSLALLYPRPVRLIGANLAYWEWTLKLADKLSPGRPWPEIQSPAVPPPGPPLGGDDSKQ